MNYLCMVSRDIPVESEGRPQTSNTTIYTSLSCSFPQERGVFVEGIEGQRQIDRFTFRIPNTSNVRIGDRITNIRDAKDIQVFNDLIVMFPNKRRTHIEVIARRVQ